MSLCSKDAACSDDKRALYAALLEAVRRADGAENSCHALLEQLNECRELVATMPENTAAIELMLSCAEQERDAARVRIGVLERAAEFYRLLVAREDVREIMRRLAATADGVH